MTPRLDGAFDIAGASRAEGGLSHRLFRSRTAPRVAAGRSAQGDVPRQWSDLAGTAPP